MADQEAAGADPDASYAPKFGTDRSHYGPALEGWLVKVRPDATDVVVSDVDIPSATGFSNETIFFNASWTEDGVEHSDRYVGRIEPPDGGIFPIQQVGLEQSVALQARIMEAVREQGVVPIPSIIGFESDPSVIGQPFFVMNHIEGVVPADVPRYSTAGFLHDEATPEQRRRLVENALSAMGALHSIDWKAAGLDWLDASGIGKPTTAVQLDVYRRYVDDELAGREHPVMTAAFEWLEANDPNDERVGLSWGDSRLGNILWQDYEVAAVVDWEQCSLCPTEADLGWFLMYDRMSFDDMGVDRMEGFPTRDEMIAYYEKASGREVRNPHYWEVFGAMRFCAIFIRLADRMSRAGILPANMDLAVANMVTDALATLLDIDNPTPSKLS